MGGGKGGVESLTRPVESNTDGIGGTSENFASFGVREAFPRHEAEELGIVVGDGGQSVTELDGIGGI